MKIMYFSLGDTTHDIQFVSTLQKTGHEISLCGFEGWSGKWLEWILSSKYNSFIENMVRLPRQVRNFKKSIAENAPDVIHAGPLHGSAFRVALSGFHPLVTLSWGSDLMLEADRNLATRWITRYTLAHTDVLCGDSKCIHEKAEKFGYRGPYFQFPWGVDLKVFSPGVFTELRERLGWQNNAIFLSVRSFENLYDVDCIVNAFILAEKERPDIRLLIYGSGSRLTTLRDSLKSAGILHKTYFGGRVNDERMIEAYHSADLYLAATHSDGASVSLMEALACGLPALVSDIPGNAEWIEHGVNGWRFKTGNAEDLARYMVKFDKDSPEVKKMRQQNRKLAEERADWSKNFPVLLQAYEKAIEIHREKA
jgi:L-malate glycosyltransferase